MITMFRQYGPHHMMGYSGYGMVWLILFILLLLVLLFLGYKLIQASRKEEDKALVILRERYANGELTDEEFEQKKKILQK